MDRLLIAIISKPQGIKGEVKCNVLTDVLSVFNGKIKEFYVNGKLMKAEHVAFRQGAVYIKFADINTRNDAELYRNKQISIERSLIEEDLEDEILLDDLIGKVLLDKNNKVVGQVVDCENYGATDILTILEGEHAFQVPFVKEIFTIKGKDVIVDREKYEENKI